MQETKRPSKEMQVTIARQLGLEPTTVGNFFMNARRRSHDKWREDGEQGDENDQELCDEDFDNMGHTIMEEDENVKYEVYDNGSTAHMYTPQEQAFLEATGGIPTQQQMQDDPTGYHHMTTIPGPVHNQHNQIHSYSSSCA